MRYREFFQFLGQVNLFVKNQVAVIITYCVCTFCKVKKCSHDFDFFRLLKLEKKLHVRRASFRKNALNVI